MKREIIILSILLLVLIIPAIFALQNIVSCEKDSDCISLKADCCGCSSGGKAMAINKDYKKSYEDDLLKSCANTACIAVISNDPSCGADKKPLCINYNCVLSNQSNNKDMVGNDRDSHGCIGSAGYQWCEEKQKCLRIWEENCSDCVKEGESNGGGISPSSDTRKCCGGLTSVYSGLLYNNNTGKCEDSFTDGPNICIKCGDGICRDKENICNCPQDCNKTLPGTGKVKILPETASLRARERLGELGFNISLKEVQNPKSDKVGPFKYIYEVKAKKEGKLFGFLKVHGDVSAEVDAETGEVLKVHKPWWAFMAGI